MTEEWRPIPGYEGFYEVSSVGRVRSLPRETVGVRGRFAGVTLRYQGKTLSLTPHPDGYRYVHGLDACHRNGDPTDDRVQNLYWGTKSQNAADSVRHGTNANIRKTECPRKHPYDDVNTMRRPNGQRRCAECERVSARERMRRRRVDLRTAS